MNQFDPIWPIATYIQAASSNQWQSLTVLQRVPGGLDVLTWLISSICVVKVLCVWQHHGSSLALTRACWTMLKVKFLDMNRVYNLQGHCFPWCSTVLQMMALQFLLVHFHPSHVHFGSFYVWRSSWCEGFNIVILSVGSAKQLWLATLRTWTNGKRNSQSVMARMVTEW